jgi:hypothetical protein
MPLPEWVQKVDCGVLGQYGYGAHATKDDGIVKAKTEKDEEIFRETRSKVGEEVQVPE